MKNNSIARITKIKTLSNEELLELVREEKNESAGIKEKINGGRKSSNLRGDKSNISKFLSDLELKDGSVKVPNYLLYYYYATKWEPTGKKISKIGFLRKISGIFKSKRTGTTRYIMLNNSKMNLEFSAEAKRWDNSRREDVRKEKKEKESGQVSGTKQESTC